MTTPTIPFYPVTHDDGTNIVSALNNIVSARRMPIIIADTFSTLESYNIGDYVIYENNMYRFTSAHSIGTWDSTQVVQVTVGEELEDLSKNQDSINSSISAIDSSLAIIADGDTHIAITSGQYVYVKNHNILTEGLYTANSAIGANVALTTSNLTSVSNSNGGFNKINSNITTINSSIATINSNITTINGKLVAFEDLNGGNMNSITGLRFGRVRNSSNMPSGVSDGSFLSFDNGGIGLQLLQKAGIGDDLYFRQHFGGWSSWKKIVGSNA